MEPIIDFTLGPIDDQVAHDSSICLYKGKRTGISLPGRLIAAQFLVEKLFLLFLEHDNPFEERLDICLLASDFRIIDRCFLVWPYTAATLRDLTVRSSVEIEFSFFGEKYWVIKVSKKACLIVPIMGDPRGVWRPLGLYRHLLVRTERRRITARSA